MKGRGAGDAIVYISKCCSTLLLYMGGSGGDGEDPLATERLMAKAVKDHEGVKGDTPANLLDS